MCPLQWKSRQHDDSLIDDRMLVLVVIISSGLCLRQASCFIRLHFLHVAAPTVRSVPSCGAILTFELSLDP